MPPLFTGLNAAPHGAAWHVAAPGRTEGLLKGGGLGIHRALGHGAARLHLLRVERRGAPGGVRQRRQRRQRLVPQRGLVRAQQRLAQLLRACACGQAASQHVGWKGAAGRAAGGAAARTGGRADAGVPRAPLHTFCVCCVTLIPWWPALLLLALLFLAARPAAWYRTCLGTIARLVGRSAPDGLLGLLGPEVAVIEAALWCATGEPELSSHTSHFCPEVMVF